MKVTDMSDLTKCLSYKRRFLFVVNRRWKRKKLNDFLKNICIKIANSKEFLFFF